MFVTKILDDGRQKFLDGEYEGGIPTVTCSFKHGLLAGEYLILFSVDFLDCHPLRRIIVSTYCEDETEMVRLCSKQYGYEKFLKYEDALAERKQNKEYSIELA